MGTASKKRSKVVETKGVDLSNEYDNMVPGYGYSRNTSRQ